MASYEEGSKKKSKRRRKHRRKHPLLGFVIFVAIIAGVIFFMRSEYFNVDKLEIEGNKYFTRSQVQQISGIETGMNIFFDVKASNARKQLLESPYIKLANISRSLPSTVKISIEERTEYAAIEYQGAYFVIDDEGMILRTSETEPQLTLLEGIEIDDSEVGKPLNAKQSYLLSGSLELLKKTGENDLYFKKIYFSSAVVRAYIYDDYYCEGTPENITENLAAIKELVAQHFQEDITKGVIKVGTGGYLSFNPKID